MKLKWTKIADSSGGQPLPRHGHRAVVIEDMIIIFGGGNRGIMDELNVYNSGKLFCSSVWRHLLSLSK